MSAREIVCDVAVVGGGPAGMTCASVLVAGGLRVALLDAGSALGGQYWRHAPGEGVELSQPDLHHGIRTYRRLAEALDAASQTGTLEVLCGHDVWTATGSEGLFEVRAVDRTTDRAVTVTAIRVVVATGAYDRSLPFPGWDLPGVMTVGGVQSLLKGSGVVAGRRVALGGTGPFLLPVATALAARGAQITSLCEASDMRGWGRQLGAVLQNPSKITEGLGYAGRLARHRIAPRLRSAIVAAHGDSRVEEVSVAQLDSTARIVAGTERRVAADVVGVGWGFIPQLDLALTLGCDTASAPGGSRVVSVDDIGRTSVRGVYAAGEPCGIGGAVLACARGELAGYAILRDAGRTVDAAAAARALVAVHRAAAFGRALAAAHPFPHAWPGWCTDDTTVCRCEEVTRGQVRAAIAAGADGHRQVKQVTRAGMGWCQGRVCGPAINDLCGESGAKPGSGYLQSERLVTVPVPLHSVAESNNM